MEKNVHSLRVHGLYILTTRDEIFKRDCERLLAHGILCKLATFEFQVQIFK